MGRSQEQKFVDEVTGALQPDDLTPKAINLHIGQLFQRDHDKYLIKKFYRNHVLCLVNGKYHTAIKYFDFLQGRMKKLTD